ncbi:MAG TPA: polysaccharide deacetylase family protein, partial [Chthoniobacterales bacterium]|nr:polysaccharide deacetylase family protein [Chthoniobacterales bacterium]
MFFRRFIVPGAIISLAAQISFSQETKPAAPVEKPAASPVRPKATPTPTEPPITFNSVHVDGPYIALTFDDGPNATLTPKLLDLLAARHLKATFFVVGQNAADHPEILRRAVREGHEIANHSWSHPNLGKMSDEAVRRELQRTDDAIAAAIGKRPTLMRPPYGSLTARQKKWIHEEFGYRIIIWDVDPLDWKRPGPSVVTARILKETHAGSIVLSHDI